MKGSTHFAIGAAIGAAASLYYPFSFNNAALYLSVASFSALSADLDGTSLLSSTLGKVSKSLRDIVLWAGVLLSGVTAYLYFMDDRIHLTVSVVAVTLLLLGFVSKEGIIRNILVSMVGLGLLYAGWYSELNWLMGLGGFVAWVPWLKHRGLTHTIWAVMLWGALGWGLQNHLQVPGIMSVSIAGYVSHLLADTFTPAGVKWLFPLYNRSIKFRV
ncbi:metal-dependent hydrolase [Cohnella kolymensis]|uniref:Metal-dependent hydrolase n=1 Tax=Cohnella kolymensis TaxID=1590652 RepID=A0ABR5A0W8_9BACL|nr:metal-dependent hydrolase [Cohnella kolymensis]KIL34210.1 metal-dependent hydrolase [Cohnella kolymensis]